MPCQAGKKKREVIQSIEGIYNFLTQTKQQGHFVGMLHL